MIINVFLAYLGTMICYYLTLSFVNVNASLRKAILPISIITLFVFLWKRFLNTPPSIYTVFLVVLFGLIVYLFTKTNIFLSFIGSMLTFITLTFGSMLLTCPLFLYWGWDISKIKMSPQFDWIILNLTEYLVPLIVLIIMRSSKFSIVGHLKFIQE